MAEKMEIDEVRLEAGQDVPEEKEEEDPQDLAIKTVLSTTHLVMYILDIVKEKKREELFVVGTRTRQGNLRGFLDFRLVNREFDKTVRSLVRREFRKVRIAIDDNYISCNFFTIHRHLPVAPPPRMARPIRRQRDELGNAVREMLGLGQPAAVNNEVNMMPIVPHPPAPDVPPVEPVPPAAALIAQNLHQLRQQPDSDSEDDAMSDADDEIGSESDADAEIDPNEHEMEEEREENEDSRDAQFIQRFLQWLADTFHPTVETFKVYDSWTFKPCSVPATWTQIEKFMSFHPDMDYCNCARCIEIVRNSNTFGPISCKLAEDALKEQCKTFRLLSCTDLFLPDLANFYTLNRENHAPLFDTESFKRDLGGIKCEELIIAVQVLPEFNDPPCAQPLEVIQQLIKLWEVKTIHFEIVKVMENEFYMQRRSWETTGAFHLAHFISYRFDTFDESRHVMPYREFGTLDSLTRNQVIPIFDLRIDLGESTRRMSSRLSLLSLASTDNVAETGYPIDWPFQGRVVFNMFKSNHYAFILSSQPEFQGVVGMVNWLKYEIRGMLRWTWGPRPTRVNEANRTVYWIFFIEDGMCIKDIWRDHMPDLLQANFPRLQITMNSEEGFNKCPCKRVRNYFCVTRPDILDKPVKSYYATFYDSLKNNTTHLKFVQVTI